MKRTSYWPKHHKCIKHRLHGGDNIVDIFEELEDTVVVKETRCTTILYVLRNDADISYGKVNSYRLTKGDLMLFPPGMRITARIKGPSKVMVLRLDDNVTLCDDYTLDRLYQKHDKATLSHAHLKSKLMVRLHLDYLAKNIANGLSCVHFLEMKVRELFYYLHTYYKDEELARFYLPMLGKDAKFMDFIWKNYRKVHNASDFADIANCSMSSFKSRFKRITGESVTSWLMERRARNVYHEINCTDKSIRDISEEYQFASVSHLGEFCRKMFGTSPINLKHRSVPDENMSGSDKNMSHCDTVV